MRQCCVGDLLKRRAARDPELIAAIHGDIRVSYAALNERTNAAAHFLRNREVGRGDRVAVMGRNSVDYFELYFACAKLGAILCGLNIRLSRSELHANLEDSHAKILLADDEFASVALALGDSLGIAVFVMQGAHADSRSYDRLRDESATDELSIDVSASDPLVLVYTSGTTGRSKGAVLTQSQMYWASATQIHSLDYRHHDVNLIAAPLFHVGGLSLATLSVHLGETALLLTQWDAQTVLELIDQERVNHFFAVPAMLKTLLDALSSSRKDLDSLRWIVSGGAPTPPELIRSLADRGISVLQSYGATETAGPAACLRPDRAVAKANTVGRPYFDTDIRIVTDDGNVCATGAIGEIQVRGPHVFEGYWNNPEATRAAFDGEWFRTGDLGSIDPEGDISIVGRAKDMIITGGENVYPVEVELVLQTHPAIADVVVVGQPDADWGESLCAVVVLRPGADITLGELERHCRDNLARYKIPRLLELRSDPLPRNASGKVLRQSVVAELGIASDTPSGSRSS